MRALQNKMNVPGLEFVSPVVYKVVSVSYGSETKRATVRGGTDLITKILNIYPEDGVFYTYDDIKQRASVAVLGAKVKEELFGDLSAVGKKIKIQGKSFRVVGVLSKKGQVGFINPDEMVMIPYTTAQKYLLGIDYYHGILAQAKSEELVPEVVHDITLTLRQMHNITDPKKMIFILLLRKILLTG